jgi:hypothetical protein
MKLMTVARCEQICSRRGCASSDSPLRVGKPMTTTLVASVCTLIERLVPALQLDDDADPRGQRLLQLCLRCHEPPDARRRRWLVELLLRRFLFARAYGRADAFFVLANAHALSYAIQVLTDMHSGHIHGTVDGCRVQDQRV